MEGEAVVLGQVKVSRDESGSSPWALTEDPGGTTGLTSYSLDARLIQAAHTPCTPSVCRHGQRPKDVAVTETDKGLLP